MESDVLATIDRAFGVTNVLDQQHRTIDLAEETIWYVFEALEKVEGRDAWRLSRSELKPAIISAFTGLARHDKYVEGKGWVRRPFLVRLWSFLRQP